MTNVMDTHTSTGLRYERHWQAAGWVMVLIVIWLSLMPKPPQMPSILGWDKAQHMLAYGSLMYWFGMCHVRHWRWPAFLLALGLGLEFIQGASGYRSFDPYDMIANTLGVGVGLLMLRTAMAQWLSMVDGYIASKPDYGQQFIHLGNFIAKLAPVVTAASLALGVYLFDQENQLDQKVRAIETVKQTFTKDYGSAFARIMNVYEKNKNNPDGKIVFDANYDESCKQAPENCLIADLNLVMRTNTDIAIAYSNQVGDPDLILKLVSENFYRISYALVFFERNKLIPKGRFGYFKWMLKQLDEDRY